MRYTFRQLLQSPGFALAAVVSLALGIGANTAMFTLADALLFRPLPVPSPDRLLRVDTIDFGDATRQPRAMSGALVDAIRDAHVFAGVCGFLTPLTTIDIAGRIAPVSGIAASGDCFQTLGLRPAIGRLLTPEDDRETAPSVIVISYESWLQDFGGRPDVLDREIGINGDAFRIIGVVERGFPGLLVGFPARVYFAMHHVKLPSQLTYASLGQTLFARLSDGDTAAGVAAHLETAWPGWVTAAFSGADRSRYLVRRPVVASGATGVDFSLRRRFGNPLLLLVAVASLVLLVAAVNVANLLLARSASRRRETVVRLALGATRWQIVRLVLLESSVILLIAVSGALLVASWCDRVLVDMFQQTSPTFALDVTPDWRALACTAVAACGAFLVFALGPAFRSADVDLASIQLASSRTTRDRARARRVILIAQVAMTLVLVGIGSVFVEALASLRRAPLGIDVEHVLTMQLSALPAGYENGVGPTPYYRTLVDRVRGVPGIISATLDADTPFVTAPHSVDVSAANQPPAAAVSAEEDIITDRFFETMKIPLVAGDDFRPADAQQAEHTAIVSASLAKRLFGAAPAVGRMIRTGTRPELQRVRIVGVARDAVLGRPQDGNALIVYQNWWQAPMFFPTLVMRTQNDPLATAGAVGEEVRRQGRELPIRIRTLEAAFTGSLAQERLLASLSGSFSAVGLILAAVGLYGLLAFSVANRTGEIGVRMALGASRSGILRLVADDAAVIIAAGLAIGAPIAWVAARTAGRVLLGTQPGPALPLLAAALALALTGALAAVAPAWRATSINPLDALRRE